MDFYLDRYMDKLDREYELLTDEHVFHLVNEYAALMECIDTHRARMHEIEAELERANLDMR